MLALSPIVIASTDGPFANPLPSWRTYFSGAGFLMPSVDADVVAADVAAASHLSMLAEQSLVIIYIHNLFRF